MRENNRLSFHNSVIKIKTVYMYVQQTMKTISTISTSDLILVKAIQYDNQYARIWFPTKRKRKRSDSVLWQKPINPQNSKTQRPNTKNATKTSTAQPLRTDLGRSVEVTTAIPVVWLSRFTRAQPSFTLFFPESTASFECDFETDLTSNTSNCFINNDELVNKGFHWRTHTVTHIQFLS